MNVAKQSCEELLKDEIEEESYRGFIPGLEIAARVATHEKKYDIAAQLFFNAQALRKKLGTPIIQSEKPLYDTLLTDLKNNLSEKKYILASEQQLDNHQLPALANLIIKP